MALPTTDLTLWNEARAIVGLTAGDPAGTLPGLGGKQDLTQATGAAKPEYRVVGGQPELYLDGIDDYMVAASSITLKHLFAAVRYDAATFIGYDGVIVGTGGAVFLRGQAGVSRFYPYDWDTTSEYRLNGTLLGTGQSDTATGPMNAYAIVELSRPNGWNAIPLLGNDVNAAGRFWKGSIRALAGYSAVLAGADRSDALSYMALAPLGQTFNVAQTAEAEAAHPFAGIVKTAAMAAALETDAATPPMLTAKAGATIGEALELDLAAALAASRSTGLATALETDAALALAGGVRGAGVAQALELDTAHPLTVAGLVPVVIPPGHIDLSAPGHIEGPDVPPGELSP